MLLEKEGNANQDQEVNSKFNPSHHDFNEISQHNLFDYIAVEFVCVN